MVPRSNRSNLVIASCLALLVCVSAAADADLVARVGETEITRATLDRAVSAQADGTYFHGQSRSEARIALERRVLDRLIRNELNVLGGLDEEMALPEEAAEATRESIEKQLGTEEYERSIAANGWSREDHRRQLARTLLGTAAYQRFVRTPATVTDGDVEQEYRSRTSTYRRPESAHVMHLLVRVPPDATDDEVTVLRARAEALGDRVTAGETFAVVASSSSDDAWRVKGGDLGWVHKGRLLPQLDDFVWSAEPNSVSAPIRSGEGWHVVQVAERQEERQLSFEEAAPMIREVLERTRLDAAESAWYDAVRARHPVTILAPELRGGR